MQVSHWVIFGVIELIGLLILICLYLLMHTRSLKQLVLRLQSRLKRVAFDLKVSRQASNDPGPEQPPTATDDTEETPAEEMDIEALQKALSDSQRRVENLKQFKTLFLELEEKWQNAQNQAQEYHSQISHLASDTDHKDEFDTLLQGYQAAYEDFSHAFRQQDQSEQPAATVETPIEPSAELERLKSIASNQHNLISELQQRLAVAYSSADKEALIDDLKTQLDQQLRYLNESETCVKLMERELSDAHEQITRLKSHVTSRDHQLRHDKEENRDLRRKLAKLEEEHEQKSLAIQRLKQESEQLVLQMQATLEGQSEGASHKELDQLRSDYEGLQQQYTELESKYLSMRLKA
ncbi:hypothetical protein KOI40_13420 [Aestuariicella sp. G3-2]|uniref:hypothetical protein n=1 Tax=Pseudomaricurvus albidus TaxID=2842452 RepID=UPI001C0E08FC|nr:hypothetical protein [Aestuariicella albida]MBU3070822.1 hypothetical protein [Aestuariicella albida]